MNALNLIVLVVPIIVLMIGELRFCKKRNGLSYLFLSFIYMVIINVVSIVVCSVLDSRYVINHDIRILSYISIGIILSLIILIVNIWKKDIISDFLVDKKLDNTLMIFAISSIILLVLSICGIEINYSINNMNIFFIIISIISNLLLVKIIVFVADISDTKLDKFEWKIIAICEVVVLMGCAISVYTREYAYYWDEVREYAGYFRIEDMFNQSIYYGICNLFREVRSQLRGPLINVFLGVPFVFTNRTPDSWVMAISFNIFPVLGIVLALVIKNIQKIFIELNNHVSFLSIFIAFFSMPLLFASYLSGFPDLFEVVFCLIIMLCVFNTKFEVVEYRKWVFIYLTTIILAMLRSQYIVWIISFYFSYFIVYYIKMLINKEYDKIKKCFLHMIYFGILFLIILFLTMHPYIKNYFASFNMGTDNSFWRVGGYCYTIINQVNYLGKWLVVLIVLGIVISLVKKQSRLFGVFTIIHGVSTLVIFHSQVTMISYNHSLVMIPFYMLCIVLISLLIVQFKNQMFSEILSYIFIVLSTFNLICSIFGGIFVNDIFTNISLMMSECQVEQIRVIADWITESCEEEERVYFIPHNEIYNPDKFRYINMPDRTVMNKMSYGSAVLGYHGFPTELFEAKYILTSSPFDAYSIEQKYNDAFLEYLSKESKFRIANEFDMGDGYIITAYERVAPVDLEEINFYRKVMEEENKQYPVLYDDVFNNYIKSHGEFVH